MTSTRHTWAGRAALERGEADEAKRLLERAIELDPDYAPAHSWLAECAINAAFWTGSGVETMPAAKRAALRALELDDSLAEPHLLLGKIRAHYEWEWRDAERHFKRAIELNPNHANAFSSYAMYLIIMGRREEAFSLAERALELDPLSPPTLGTLGNVRYFGGDVERGISYYRAARSFNPESAVWPGMLGCAYLDSGRRKEAFAALEQAVPLARFEVLPHAILAWAWGRVGEREKAEQVLAQIRWAQQPESQTAFYSLMAHFALGDNDRAYALLDTAIEARWPFLGTITVIPAYDPMRNDPRYAGFVERIGLAGIAEVPGVKSAD